MFVHKLQIFGVILILLSIIHTSTTFVIRNTNDSINVVPDDDTPSYPTHSVDNIYRGDLISMQHICLHWIDGDHISRWYECRSDGDFDGKKELTTEWTSPGWAAGYYFEAYDEYYGKHYQTDDVMWYYGNQGQKYCNDLHFHIKGFHLKLSYSQSTTTDKCYWE